MGETTIQVNNGATIDPGRTQAEKFGDVLLEEFEPIKTKEPTKGKSGAIFIEGRPEMDKYIAAPLVLYPTVKGLQYYFSPKTTPASSRIVFDGFNTIMETVPGTRTKTDLFKFEKEIGPKIVKAISNNPKKAGLAGVATLALVGSCLYLGQDDSVIDVRRDNETKELYITSYRDIIGLNNKAHATSLKFTNLDPLEKPVLRYMDIEQGGALVQSRNNFTIAALE